MRRIQAGFKIALPRIETPSDSVVAEWLRYPAEVVEAALTRAAKKFAPRNGAGRANSETVYRFIASTARHICDEAVYKRPGETAWRLLAEAADRIAKGPADEKAIIAELSDLDTRFHKAGITDEEIAALGNAVRLLRRLKSGGVDRDLAEKIITDHGVDLRFEDLPRLIDQYQEGL